MSIQSPFLPNSRTFPQDNRLLQQELTNSYVQTAYAVNVREIGLYDLTQQPTGKLYFSENPNVSSRFVLRNVYRFTSLPMGVTTIPHGIPLSATLEYTEIKAVANSRITPTTFSAVPIPFVNVTTPTNGIQFDLDETNIYLTTTTADWVGYFGTIVLEYIP